MPYLLGPEAVDFKSSISLLKVFEMYFKVAPLFALNATRKLNNIIFSLDPSPSLPNWLRYGEYGEHPAVRQESDSPMSCHRGRRDGRF